MNKFAYALLVISCCFTFARAAERPDKPPNILFIVSEDNSDHLGCYGEKRVHTPHLDALAAGGVRYTRAYVPYSVCSPSRAAFLTGLYTRQTGHIGLATHRFAMYKDFKTMPAYFRAAGYYTGFLGKTHVNPERVVEDHVDHRAIRQSNFGKTISIKRYAEEARAVMRNAAEQKKPFHLIINYADAHRSFVGKSKNGFPSVMVDKEIAPYPWIGSDSPRLRQELRDYLNCINRLDEGVGMVLDELQAAGVRDNTLVVYMADHGADFPRAKGSIYENGTRIPMIVNDPKRFAQGKVENGMVSTIDILPTMLKAAGQPVPEQLPGIALQDIDTGKVPARSHIHTFTTGSSPNLLYLQFGIRDQRYKLVTNPDRAINRLAVSRYKNSKLPEAQHVQTFLNPPAVELFDLQKDPHEWNNLADSAEHAAIKQRLLQEMRRFQREIKDPFAEPENVDTFIAEQKDHLTKPYKRSGFRWPHLDMFAKAQSSQPSQPSQPNQPSQTTKAERPNIIVIVADDLGYGDLGVTGNPTIKTPHIDALAQAGATFEHFYSPAQICSPTRAAMMTGRMPHRLGIYSFIGGSSGNLTHLPKTEVTLPQLLRGNGYQTAIIGKWHASLNEVQRNQPAIPTMNHYGFDYWFCSDDNARILDKPGWRRNGKSEGTRKGLAANVIGEEAVHWLKNERKEGAPFLQFVHFYEPHHYVAGPEDLVAEYLDGGRARNKNEAHYFAAVSNVDREVGRIHKAVKELGLADNTAILFTSDHGPAKLGGGKADRNYGSAAPYRGNKYGLWEGSIHVPGIVCWPKKITPGLAITEPAGSIDWLPTLCELTGTPVPDGLVLDGQSHLPLLLGGTIAREKPLQWHHYNTRPKNAPNPNAVLRQGRHQIVGFYDPATQLSRASWKPEHLTKVKTGKLVRFELYDLITDPQQKTNLAPSKPELFGPLKEQLQAAHLEMQTQAIGWDGVVPVARTSRPVFRAEVDTLGDHKYQSFREPVTVKTNTGRLIVGVHAGNRLGWPERSGQDLVVRTSDDQGRTWSPLIVAAEHGNFSCQSHGLVYDAEQNQLLFLYVTYNWDFSAIKGRGSAATVPLYEKLHAEGKPAISAYVVTSEDEGTTWSKPRDITAITGGDAHFGASEGRQLTVGKHAGRLVVAGCDERRIDPQGRVTNKDPGVWISDDHGTDWRFSRIDTKPGTGVGCEARVTELPDGSLVYNARLSNARAGRLMARSKDGGETWQQIGIDATLSSAKSNGCTITLRDQDGTLTENLWFTVPRDTLDNCRLFISQDGGKTWPQSHEVVSGRHVKYSALLQLDADTVGLFYETSRYQDVQFTTLGVSEFMK